jgi:hypothetical protein
MKTEIIKTITTDVPGMPMFRIKREGPLYHDKPDSYYYYVDKRCRFLWWHFWMFQTYQDAPDKYSMIFYSLELAERYIAEQTNDYKAWAWYDKQQQWKKTHKPVTEVIKEIWTIKENS